jgi:hypothetical protein
MRCAGGVETQKDGSYVYQRVFFHDTDTIKLTVTANGYQTQTVTGSSFTIYGLTMDFSLTPLP